MSLEQQHGAGRSSRLCGGITMEAAALLVAGLIFCIFWVYQFVELMLFTDADFPGKYDKCLWTAAFIFAFVLAPFALLGWKYAYKAMLAARTKSKEQES